MADFYTTFEGYILPNEGYFANLTGDPGGETYSGIARTINPNWAGWSAVDSYVNNKGGLSQMKNNEQIPLADSYVSDFYNNLWNTTKMDEIYDQNLANIIFDFIVNSGESIAGKHIQKLVGATPDGIIGDQTITAINNQNPTTLFNAIKADRASFYTQLASKSAAYANFLSGWMNRLTAFTASNPTTTGIGLGIFLLFVVILTFLSTKN